MGRRPNPALIGAFVIGAVLIAAAAVVVLGSGRFFRSTRTFVIFFQGSVNGLSKGAPVKFRGVPVGTVSEIRLGLPQVPGTTRIPVLIDIDRDRLQELGARADAARGPTIQELVRDLGLRAQLQQQSFITGLLYVGLDLFPDSPVELVLPAGAGPYPEIPSLPTTLEQARAKVEEIFDRLSRIDFETLGKSLTTAVEGVNRLVHSPKVYANLDALHETLDEIRGATADLRARVRPLIANANTTSGELRDAVERLQDSLDRFNALIDPESPWLSRLAGTLTELGEAARAVRLLAEQLERNPSVLLTGKKAP